MVELADQPQPGDAESGRAWELVFWDAHLRAATPPPAAAGAGNTVSGSTRSGMLVSRPRYEKGPTRALMQWR